ncbi:MAG: hypothetical protein U0Q12_24770 [Vicinamibacterales bacterium]
MSESAPPVRVIRQTAVTAGTAALLWALLIWLMRGLTASLAPGVTISAHDVGRPLAVAAIAFAAYALASGRERLGRRVAWLASRQGLRTLAAALAIAVSLVALRENSWTASGADAYAYLSQANLMRHARVHAAVPLAADVPWPNGAATLTPFGYATVPGRPAIVPMTAPGLSLLMALLQLVGGHCAAFVVGPIAAGVLVGAVFAIGARLGRPFVGLGAAALAATSPTVLLMAKAPMSDVPAAAAWALATAALLGESWLASALSGLSASAAVLIRPNLVVVVAALGAWAVWRDSHERLHMGRRTVAFVLGALPGCLGVAAYNWAAYGSPVRSGYGDLGALFAWSHVATNAGRYLRWLVETQTPMAAVGLVAALLPLRIVWPDGSRRPAALLGGIAALVWASYLAYTPFDAWWFLRFMLPAWPAMCLGLAAVVAAAARALGAAGASVGTLAVVAICAFELRATDTLGVFPPGEGERRYVTIAEQVVAVTEPASVIITGQHSGPLRYYSGRLTVRFDQLDEAWLDRAVDWLASQGRHPYILLEDWELPAFERRFAGASPLGSLAIDPLLAYQAYRISGLVYLFDPLRPRGPTTRPAPIVDPKPRCAPPAPE